MNDLARELKRTAIESIDRHAEVLLEISHAIWEHPELCFEEHFAHDILCDTLDRAGLHPTRHAYGLETAFEASVGAEGPEVAVICEYDALPEIGHACGHNVIAAAGIGTALGVAGLADRARGRLRVLGTPAEEGGGGKIFMMRRGALKGLDSALMVHPADRDLPTMDCIAIQELTVEYHGRASHAAAAPQAGRNALDAAVLGYMGVAALRQHIATTERVHGIFTRAGDKPNVVPSDTAAQWYVRARNLDDLERLKPRVLAALQGGADAAGCTIQHRWHDPAYADMVDDPWLLERYEANASAIGRISEEPGTEGPVVGSTDMGNVSHEVPSIHPMIAVSPRGISIHTAEFAEHARGRGGDAAVIDGAKALACTIIDVWLAGGVGE